jgi:hypothetical protein
VAGSLVASFFYFFCRLPWTPAANIYIGFVTQSEEKIIGVFSLAQSPKEARRRLCGEINTDRRHKGKGLQRVHKITYTMATRAASTKTPTG